MVFFFPLLGLLVALVRIIFFDKPFVETMLGDLLFYLVGLGSLFAFTGHVFKSDMVAEKIGWPKGNPFQLEVGAANLSYGALGIASLWFQGHFWTATVICVSTFYLGAGLCHIADAVKNKNKSELNAGFPLYYDFILPAVLTTLLILYLSGY